jgi:outer membrane biosynthesis protein TonB
LTALSAGRAAAQDDSPSLVRNVPAAFPPELKARGITSGRAQIAALVDASGKVTDCLVTAATEPEFGAAAAAAIRQWVFDAGGL